MATAKTNNWCFINTTNKGKIFTLFFYRSFSQENLDRFT